MLVPYCHTRTLTGAHTCMGLVTFSLALLESLKNKTGQRVFLWACDAIGVYDVYMLGA